MTTSEKRSGPRVAVNADATLQVLGEVRGSNGEAVPVHIVDASERGMRMQAGIQVKSGQAVKVELGETMFLGEVCYCAPAPGSGAGVFHIGIVTEQCLSGLSGLRHLITALQPEKERRPQRV